MSMSIEFSTKGLGLDELEATALEAVRPAAQAGAQVLYDQVKANVQRIRKVSGNLDRAIYQAFMDTASNPGRASYRVSWNRKKAPHGWLIEFGFLQRYELARDARGRIFPMVRPEMQGKPKPKRRATQAVKDAYYVPRKGGPRQVPARAFIRSAASKLPAAQRAVAERFFAELKAKGLIK